MSDDALTMDGNDAPVAGFTGKPMPAAETKPAFDLNDPTIREAIERAVAERNQGLENNRNKLKEELKAAKERAKALEDAYAGVDPDLYKNLLTAAEKAEQERAERERKALEEKGEYTKVLQQKDELHGKQLAEYEARVKAAMDEKAAIERRLHTSLAMSQLQSALVEQNVKEPALLQGAIALLQGKVTLDVDGDAYVVKMDGIPLQDAVKAWAGSDAGKFYVTSPMATGGGTAPSTGDTTSTAKFPKNRSKMTLQQKLAYINEHGQTAYNSLPM